MLQQVQQQIHRYKERTNAKLQMIEELVSLAVQKVEVQSRICDKFVNPFGRVKTGVGSYESLKHLKLNFPKYKEAKGVTEWIEDCELYFDIFGVQDRKKVVIAGMPLEGLARSWYQVFFLGKTRVRLEKLLH